MIFHTSNARRLFALLAIPAALAFPGYAAANSFGADADCDGVTVNMARGEAGTVVTVTVDGRPVATRTVAAQFDPVNLTVATPDRTVAHTWVVTVDSLYNTDQRWSETVPACVTPSTTTTVPASSTTTTVPVSPTTVATTAPTTLPPTVITTPRPTPSSTTSTVPFRLPDTGRDTSRLAGFAVGCLLGGLILLVVVRRGGAK